MTSTPDPGWRCSPASLGRGESLAGTASTVRAFLLVQNAGPWGVDAVRDSRLPEAAKQALAKVKQAKIRPLLIRGQRTDGVRVFLARNGTLRTALLDRPEDLADLDLDSETDLLPHHQPVFAVCTHGRHDTCCAELGRPLAKAMAQAAPEETWEVSHIGGDRFAGNVLVLPQSLYYGRVQPSDAAALVAAHRRGEVDLAHLRGRSSLGFESQAAEIFLRERLQILGIDAIRAVSRSESTTRFAVAGQRWDVTVRTTRAEPERLTCRASRDSPAPQFELVELVEITQPTAT